MSIRLAIAILCFLMVNAVVFGIGMIAVLSLPPLADEAMTLVPLVVIGSVFVSAPLSWAIAPRLRSRFLREHVGRPG